jgi:hypothetical protein
MKEMMKTTHILFVAIAGMALVSTLMADSAPPLNADILSNVTNFDIQTNQWTISEGVLSKNSPLYHGDKLMVVKENIVKVAGWYSLRCDLVNIRKQNGKIPSAGLIFGFVDNENYWSVKTGTELSKSVLVLSQTKDGKAVFSTSTPVAFGVDDKQIHLRIEVNHQQWIKVYVNKAQILTHRTSEGITAGRVGLSLQSGFCGFSNVSIAGMAKR